MGQIVAHHFQLVLGGIYPTSITFCNCLLQLREQENITLTTSWSFDVSAIEKTLTFPILFLLVFLVMTRCNFFQSSHVCPLPDLDLKQFFCLDCYQFGQIFFEKTPIRPTYSNKQASCPKLAHTNKVLSHIFCESLSPIATLYGKNLSDTSNRRLQRMNMVGLV